MDDSKSQQELAATAIAAFRAALDGFDGELRVLSPGKSSAAFATHANEQSWVVRVPIPNSGRAMSYRSETLIGEKVAARGHCVATWTLVMVGSTLCSVAPLLPGDPIKEGTRWSDAFATALAGLLLDLHGLDCEGFGPLVDTEVSLQGRSGSLDGGIIDRWDKATIWPFDGSRLEDHPLSAADRSLAQRINELETTITNANTGPIGIVHSDLHQGHLLSDDGQHLSGLLDFGDAFIGSTAWDFALLSWYFGRANAEKVASNYPQGRSVLERADALAVAVGVYKLAKSPTDATITSRLSDRLDSNGLS